MPDAVPAFVWVQETVAPGGRFALAEDAAHHVARVCRARPGDALTVTDGRGGLARCRVERVSPDVTVVVETSERSERPSCGVLLCGAPEGQRFDWLVEKLAELGVARVRPIECSRARWSRAALRPERWRRVAVAALQQSRGRFLLEIEPPAGLDEALAAEPEVGLGLLADPGGSPAGGVTPPGAGKTVAVVGPSEGLTEEERASLLRRGVVPMALAPGRLRTETAALAWACWWAAPREAQG